MSTQIPTRLLRLPQTMAKTGLSRSSIYLQVKEFRFPAPVKIGRRAMAWRDSDIDEWIAARPAVRGE